MAVSDPVADFLTRIRNAGRAQHRYVEAPWSKLKQAIAEVLKNQGFIENYLVKTDENGRGVMRVFLKYTQDRKPVITGLKRVSKPGLRRYVGHQDIPQFFGNLGLSIVSTSQGLLAGRDAVKNKVGGELLCVVW